MIKNNIFGQALIGLLVLFLLVSSLQMFGWGMGIDAIEIQQHELAALPEIPKGIMTVVISEEEKKKRLENIYSHPMFSDTRLPFEDPNLDEEDQKKNEVPPVNELKAQLTGIVITPQQSYAMILDNLTNQRETYKVGMPLDGEQGGWTLNSIQGRKVVFVSEDDKTAELELEVFSGNLQSGGNARGKAATPLTNANKRTTSREDKKKNADDIRKKIAERRAQMRAEAAKKRK